jgi:hypothetical protein
MTSALKIAANRRNAQKSTGPRTAEGKRRSRRNAVRHGLTGETIIDAFEDAADYEAFEASIKADYRPRTVTERELVVRLASLLWRLRRATAIESGLLQIQAEAVRERRARKQDHGSEQPDQSELNPDILYPFVFRAPSIQPSQLHLDRNPSCRRVSNHARAATDCSRSDARRDGAVAFLRLVNFNDDILERIGRYESRLWRQAMQVIVLLNAHGRY